MIRDHDDRHMHVGVSNVRVYNHRQQNAALGSAREDYGDGGIVPRRLENGPFGSDWDSYCRRGPSRGGAQSRQIP